MELFLILPHQLFEIEEKLFLNKEVILIEHPYFFTKRGYHKQKLIFHRASMKAYEEKLKDLKIRHKYIEIKEAKKFLSGLKEKKISCFDPIEHELKEEIKKISKHSIWVEILPSPMFLTKESVKAHFIEKSKNHYLMQSFYILQRKDLQILVDENDKPIGGKWSFDDENRSSVPKGLAIPKTPKIKEDHILDEAIKYIDKLFPKNFGESSLIYPFTHDDARKWLMDFLKHRLFDFGAYEDAICKEHHFLFHSVLSPMLNIGLLTPKEVVDETLKFAKKHKTPLNSLEGFIRQIIGWREFMKLLYDLRGEVLKKENHFKHKGPIPKSLWDATSNIKPIDDTILKIKQTAYCHHIERLMVLGNFMLLCEMDPKEVYEWFMTLFIDAYDWVMVGNVFAMSQYADGGIMTSKPYISSSKYLLKMSDYKKEPWCEVWDALYWDFIHKHKASLQKNPRMSMMVSLLSKMSKEKLKESLETSKKFKKSLFQ